MEGNLRFKINWASLVVERKFTVFSLFYFVFEGLYLEGRFNEQFFALPICGAYIWWSSSMEGLIFGILQSLSCENEFYLHENEKSFSYQCSFWMVGESSGVHRIFTYW